MAQQTNAWALACVLGGLGMAAHAQTQDAQAHRPPMQKAQAAESAPSVPPQAQVFTRATVHSVLTEDGGRRRYIRLQLGPGSGLPFRTQTFRVRDAALVADVAPGTTVEFVARRVEGQNTLAALRAAPKIQRFEVH